MTSSPRFTPAAANAKWSAVVPLVVVTTCCAGTSNFAASSCSKRLTMGPLLNQLRSTQSASKSRARDGTDGRASGYLIASIVSFRHSFEREHASLQGHVLAKTQVCFVPWARAVRADDHLAEVEDFHADDRVALRVQCAEETVVRW